MSAFKSSPMESSRKQDLSPSKRFTYDDFLELSNRQTVRSQNTAFSLEELELEPEDLNYGEYVLMEMQRKGISPQMLCQTLDIEISLLNRIIEDQILPWYIEMDLHSKFESTLGLDRKATKKVIENHFISPESIEKITGYQYTCRSLRNYSKDHTLKNILFKEEANRITFISLFDSHLVKY